jgi:cytosine/adenosine deaminase-related metal-dependent hydrolase
MIETAKLARSLGVCLHTHLAETKDEEDYCLERYGKRPLAVMQDWGWTGEDVYFAHGIHFNDEELGVLADTKTGIAHCPSSNMRLGSGIARISDMLRLGVRVALAVDGSASNDSSDMLGELRQSLLLARVLGGADALDVPSVFKMATRNGADILGFPECGEIKEGKAADIAVFR